MNKEYLPPWKWFQKKLKEFKDDPDFINESFDHWYEENQEFWHQNMYSDKEIALSAFHEGIEYYKQILKAASR